MSDQHQLIESKVRAIVVKQLGIKEDDISLDKSFIDDLGADSLDIVELVMAMEDEFNLSISEEAAENLRTVGDAVSYISSYES